MVSNQNIYKCVFYCSIIAIFWMSLNILMLMLCFLSILAVISNHSQMLVRNYSNASVVISELSWIFLYMRVYVCHVCFDLMRSVFLLHLFAISFSFFSLSLHFFFFWLVILSCVFLLLSLVCSSTMIIVIRKIYKFDDRPDNDASVQVYYRLSMHMKKQARSLRSLGSLHLVTTQR